MCVGAQKVVLQIMKSGKSGIASEMSRQKIAALIHRDLDALQIREFDTLTADILQFCLSMDPSTVAEVVDEALGTTPKKCT